MANFTAGTSFSDGVTNDVTAAKLNALVADAVPTSNLSLNSTTGTIATFNSTTGTITGLRSTTGTVATLNSTTGTITGLNSTNGTVATLNSTTGTITNLNSTTGTVATFNSTTATIPTLTSITKITSGTGTAAAPAISPTGDTNTGIFFPAADQIAFAEGGAEAMRIDASGNVGIGVTSPNDILDIQTPASAYAARIRASASNFALVRFVNNANNNTDAIVGTPAANNLALYTNGFSERLRIDSSGNVGIGTTSATSAFQAAASKLGIEAPRASSDQTLLSLAHTGTITALDKINIGFDSFSSTNARRTMAQISALNENPAAGNPGSLLLYTNAGAASLTEQMRINSSGDVSIGTATALSKLHVHGDLTMSNATTAITASTSTITPPATIAGYLTVSINGTSRKIAYYAT